MHSKLLGSLAALVALASSACGSCGPVPVPVAHGSASASWSITTAGNVTTCARAGAATVSLLLHNRASGDDALTSFTCTDTQGTTPPLPAGTYDATLALHAADGVTMVTAPMQAAITIAGGQVTALRPETFVANDLGGLVLSIAPLRTAATCLPHDQGGQAITGHVIALTHAAGGCAAVTFTRMRGTMQVGTYTVDCSAPQVAPCIERDETLEATGIAPGPYAISVRALASTLQCGSGEDVVLVPANASTIKPIQIAPVRNFGC
jgi:hypothetical protein